MVARRVAALDLVPEWLSLLREPKKNRVVFRWQSFGDVDYLMGMNAF
jgi:hypothetical protein